ncbi:MAG: hypothetical protein HeimAB125_15930, partial [Candidatus Heimdallarchaeota archaeon AB_125]
STTTELKFSGCHSSSRMWINLIPNSLSKKYEALMTVSNVLGLPIWSPIVSQLSLSVRT